MGELPCPDGSFDLLWAEGSAYLIGFDTALRGWRRLLAPGGTLVLTHCSWTVGMPSGRARAFWADLLRTTAEDTRAARDAGYRVLGTVLLPDSDWDEYYGPLAAHADAADLDRPGMAEAVADTRAEIALRRAHGGSTATSATSCVRWPTAPDPEPASTAPDRLDARSGR